MNRFDVRVALALTALCYGAGIDAARDSPVARATGSPSASSVAFSIGLTPAELARVVEHGPWPPAFVRDPTNRVSGVPAAIDLGRRLFFDPRFSPNGYVACVACHQPDRSFTDNLPRARGLAPVERNAIALQNLRLHRNYGWGGAAVVGMTLSPEVWLAAELGIPYASLCIITNMATGRWSLDSRRDFGSTVGVKGLQVTLAAA